MKLKTYNVMNVKFDLVRIGEVRNNPIAEQLLKENIGVLKKSIITFLEGEIDIFGNGTIDIVMVIPKKSFKIKIALQDIRDKNIRKKLENYLPDSIYKGKYSILIENINNRLFGLC